MTHLPHCQQRKTMIYTGVSWLLQSSLKKSFLMCLIQINSLLFLQTTNRYLDSLMQIIIKTFLYIMPTNYTYLIFVFNISQKRKTLQPIFCLRSYLIMLIIPIIIWYINQLKKSVHIKMTINSFESQVKQVIGTC